MIVESNAVFTVSCSCEFINGFQFLLEQGEEQQNVANEMLGNTDAARNKAKEAKKLGEKIIKEAHDTFSILTGLSFSLQRSK